MVISAIRTITRLMYFSVFRADRWNVFGAGAERSGF